MEVPFDTPDVIQLKVPFKKPVPEEKLLVVGRHTCLHGPFEVDREKAEVTCKKCGEKLNPMYVLSRLASDETVWHESFKRYQDEMQRLRERSSTKCEFCKKMTRISRR